MPLATSQQLATPNLKLASSRGLRVVLGFHDIWKREQHRPLVWLEAAAIQVVGAYCQGAWSCPTYKIRTRSAEVLL